MADGKVIISTELDNSGFKRGLSGLTDKTSGLKNALASIGKTVAVAFSVAAIVNFGKEAIGLASDLDEVQNVVNTAFGTMSGQVDAWSRQSIENFGMSELAAKRMASTFMAMNTGMGMSGQGAADMAMKTAERAADIASFYNKSIEESDTMLKSIWTGETESLKQIGVVMTQTNLDAFALANGFGKTTQKMTQAEQVQLRYAYVMEQTRLASGDFLKTQDSWANQTRILSEQWKQFLSIMGSGLIQILTPALKFLNQFMAVLISWAQQFSAIVTAIFGKQVAQANAAASSTQATANATNSAADAQNSLAESTKKANKETNKQLASFDELNILKENSAASSDSSGGGVSGGGAVAGIPELSGEIGGNVTVSPKMQQAVDFIQGLFEKLKTALEPLNKALQGLWGELQRLGNFVWKGLVDFYETFLKPVGEWVLGTGLPQFVDIVKDTLSQIDWQKINDALHNLWEALKPFAIHIGEGLLWFAENVLKPLGVWVMNDAVPAFLDLLANAIEFLDSVTEAFKPLGQWLFDNFLKPIAEWTGGLIVSILTNIADALGKISDWINNNKGIVQGMTITVAAFFGAWKVVELLSFIQQSGGVIAAFRGITTAIAAGSLAKIKDKAETIALTAMYAKDFVVNLAKGTAALVKQAAQWVIATAAKAADTVATVAHTAASWAASAATTAFGIAMNILTSPITLVILAIVALVAIVILLVKNWDTVKAAAAACWEKIKEVWNVVATWFNEKVVQPVKDFFIGLWNGIQTAASTAWNMIVATWTAVSSWFNVKVIQPVQNFFTDLWNTISNFASEAWENIKKVFNSVSSWFDQHVVQPVSNGFKGFINGMLEGVENFVNFFIRGVNKIIDAINGLSFDLPDILGGGHVGFDISPIKPITLPRLAQGAVIPPNREFMAVLGDQKSGTNIEAPADLIRQIVREELEGINIQPQVNIRATGSMGALVRMLNLQVDRTSKRYKPVGT